MSPLFSIPINAVFLAFYICLIAFKADASDIATEFKKVYETEGSKAAQTFLIQEINDGSIQAVHVLAGILISGKLAEKNVPLAAEVLKKGVDLGDSKSSFLLGKYYSDGNHRQPDFTKARQFFQLAKDFGHTEAAAALSKMPQAPQKQSPKSNFKPNSQDNKPRRKDQNNEKSTFPKGYDEKRVNWSNDDLDINRVKTVGSGFALSNNGMIATNEHVVDGCAKIYVLYQGKPKIAELLKADKKSDFAVVKISGATPAFFYFKELLPELGEQLISGGFPSPENFGFGIKINTGVVSQDVGGAGTLFQHSTPSQPGNSGGPLVNSSGQIVGISTAVSTVKWGELSAQNVNYAVSSVTAKSKLDQWNLPYQSTRDNVEFKVTVLSKHLKKAAVQILCY